MVQNNKYCLNRYKTTLKYVIENSNLSNNNENMAAHYYRCRLCEAEFDNLEDRQWHELIDHIQKGEIPTEENK
jgi:hypothetical protein